MSDARWLDVEDDVAAAAKHFTNAQSLYANGRFDDLGIEGYRDGMALMHALQAGHTSAEAGDAARAADPRRTGADRR